MKQSITLVLALLLFVPGCSRLKTVQKTESIMGTEVTITAASKSTDEARAAIDAAMAEVQRCDRMMSLYKNDSEVTEVNLAAGKHPVTVSPEMIEVVEAASKVSEMTEGAFDITIGPLVVLWQMKLQQGTIPTAGEVAKIKSLVNYKNIVINRKSSTLYLRKPGMIMDLGGVAKGYAADKVVDLLRKRGIENAIVALAGDIRVMGRRPDGSPWKIGIQHPREKDRVLKVLDLSDKYISTSGDYERYKIIQKKRYHHIIDPRNGQPAEGMASITLICDRGAIGDPLTTALFVLGPEKSMQIVKSRGYDAVLEDSAGQVVMTEGITGMEGRSQR